MKWRRWGIGAALSLLGSVFVAHAAAAPSDDPETPRCHGRIAKIVGTDGGDTLRGAPGRDVIWGGLGDDTILGGLGNDLIRGGPEDDLIESGPGADRIYGGAGADGLIGGLPGPTFLYGEAHGDLLAMSRAPTKSPCASRRS